MRQQYKNGILKALRFKPDHTDTDDLMKLDAADLIEQQQQEIERLKQIIAKGEYRVEARSGSSSSQG